MHVVVLAATLIALLCLPCIVAALICADDPSDLTVWPRRRRETRALRRLDHRLDNTGPLPTPLTPVAEPTIQQLAADLRRLNQHRHGGIVTGSEVWLSAVMRAYDDRLCLASRCLGVPEHLRPLEGLDREMERLRLESELHAAGLRVSPGPRRSRD